MVDSGLLNRSLGVVAPLASSSLSVNSEQCSGSVPRLSSDYGLAKNVDLQLLSIQNHPNV